MKAKTKQSRNGKHREGKSSIGFYIDDEMRALLALVSDQSGKTATDIFLDSLLRVSTELGITRDGKVTEKNATALKLKKDKIVRHRAEKRKGVSA